MSLKDEKLNTVVKMKSVGISAPIKTNVSIVNGTQAINNVTPIIQQNANAEYVSNTNNISNMNISEIQKKVNDISSKIKNIKMELKTLFLEREKVIDDIFNCLIANQNILLLGPPGTGKSALAEEITSRIISARIFKWLLNRTSDPSEILGPISIKGMEKDQFIRKLDGKIADCEIAFLDEIFKCNEPTLNALLPIMNEKIIYNNGQAVPIPLKMVIAASNETPEEEELGALYDRILIKHWIDYIKDPGNREEMLKRYNGKGSQVSKTYINIVDLDFMQSLIKKVEIPANILTSYGTIINKLSVAKFNFSDRKLNWATDLIKANALIDGRLICDDEDLFAITYAFWEEKNDIPKIQEIIGKLINPEMQAMKDLYLEAQEIFTKVKETYKSDKTKGTEETIEAKQKIDILVDKMDKIINKIGNDPKVNKFISIKNDVANTTTKMIQTILNINTSNATSNATTNMDLDFDNKVPF